MMTYYEDGYINSYFVLHGMYCVILCGGSGSRLWPLSRKNFPKQFLSLYSDYSLLQETFFRMQKVVSLNDIFLVTNKENFFNVFNQIHEIYTDFSKENILVEPKSLNTAPAILLAMKYLQEKMNAKNSTPVVVVPSDHFIGNMAEYITVMKRVEEHVSDNIGTIGITPKKAETGYGYIEKGEQQENFFEVSAFKEKPDVATAKKYIESGVYLWNSGMYVFNIQTFFEQLKKHASGIYAFVEKDFEYLLENFSKIPSISIDHALSEKSDKMVVFEGDFSWSDIGSFDALSEVEAAHKSNARHVGINSKNVFTHSTGGHLIVTSGVDDIIVIENKDSILIQKKGESENVKNIVEHFKKENYSELEHNMLVHRPWGSYEILIDMPHYKVKKLVVYPGAKLSLQSHKHRTEHWVVVVGVANVVNGEKEFLLQANESTYIPFLCKHRLANTGDKNLEIVEVQTGEYLGEDDIERYEDIYNRLEE